MRKAREREERGKRIERTEGERKEGKKKESNRTEEGGGKKKRRQGSNHRAAQNGDWNASTCAPPKPFWRLAGDWESYPINGDWSCGEEAHLKASASSNGRKIVASSYAELC